MFMYQQQIIRFSQANLRSNRIQFKLFWKKLSKAQIYRIIQSRISFRSLLGSLGKKALTNIEISLARDNLLGLVSNLTSNAINKFERKKVEKKLWDQIEDVNDAIEIIKLLEGSCVLIDGVTETINMKQEITKTVINNIKRTRRQISRSFFSIFSLFNNATSYFFSSQTCKWKRS